MSDVAEPKPGPATGAAEAEKPQETTPATTEAQKPAEEKSTTESAVDAAKEATSKTTDSVFSMFGGGPKKEKKEEPEDAKDEPSGSSKAQKGEDEVSVEVFLSSLTVLPLLGLRSHPQEGGETSVNFFPCFLCFVLLAFFSFLFVHYHMGAWIPQSRQKCAEYILLGVTNGYTARMRPPSPLKSTSNPSSA